jgi:hypothetical protein
MARRPNAQRSLIMVNEHRLGDIEDFCGLGDTSSGSPRYLSEADPTCSRFMSSVLQPDFLDREI